MRSFRTAASLKPVSACGGRDRISGGPGRDILLGGPGQDKERRVGKTSGHSDVFGIEYDAVYAETADFEFASEMAEGAATGRG